MPTLTTSRLELKPMEPDDLAWYAEFAGDAAVMQYIGHAGPLSHQQATERLARYVRCWEEHGLGMFGVRLREELLPVGWAGLQPLSGTDEIEVGYAFARAAWGRGYATEVASAIVQWGFAVLGLERIVAVASPENTGSRRVMDKLGMRYEGVRPGSGQDSVYYSLTPAAFTRAAPLRALARGTTP
ncbi:MAG TPA: GNAT family N-acetyltransferase [Gemmatimonadaceae bacterium]|nr:GNAT family N-acetyltransferase [Gemmatimonadaceae bacterium]